MTRAPRSIRRHPGPLLQALGVVWATAALGVAAAPDAPLPPDPEPAAAVQPAGLAVEAGRTGSTLAPLPLAPVDGAVRGAAAPARRPLPDWKLLGVLGAAFAGLAAYRVLAKRAAPTLPPDVFEVLGEAVLAGGHAVRVVRFGPKTLLVGVSAAGCQTLIGETHLLQNQLDDAVREYFKVYLNHPHDSLRAPALLQAALCELKLGKNDAAIRDFREVVASFPQSPEAVRASDELKKLKAAVP